MWEAVHVWERDEGRWNSSLSQSCSQQLPQTLKNRSGITQCMSPASGFSLRPKCLLLSTNAYTFLRRRCRKTKLGWWWDGEWGSPLLVKGKGSHTPEPHWSLYEATLYSVRLFFWCSRTLEKNGHSKNLSDDLTALQTACVLLTAPSWQLHFFLPHSMCFCHCHVCSLMWVKCSVPTQGFLCTCCGMFSLLGNSSILSVNGQWAILLTAKSARGYSI